jgi:large subunit ribosomal protein L10
LLAQVVGGIQAPISGLVGALAAIIRSLLYVVNARKDQLQAAPG